jgi:hypothetical protein
MKGSVSPGPWLWLKIRLVSQPQVKSESRQLLATQGCSPATQAQVDSGQPACRRRRRSDNKLKTRMSKARRRSPECGGGGRINVRAVLPQGLTNRHSPARPCSTGVPASGLARAWPGFDQCWARVRACRRNPRELAMGVAGHGRTPLVIQSVASIDPGPARTLPPAATLQGLSKRVRPRGLRTIDRAFPCPLYPSSWLNRVEPLLPQH